MIGDNGHSFFYVVIHSRAELVTFTVEQFLKTLEFLKQHERKANKLYNGDLNLENRIDYLTENGFYHYGIVITGQQRKY